MPEQNFPLVQHRINGAPSAGSSTRRALVYDPALGEVTCGLEAVELATGFPTFIKGEHSENAPTAVDSFGGWKDSLFGDSKAYGWHGFDFFTREKAITSRWLEPSHGGINLGFPQTK